MKTDTILQEILLITTTTFSQGLCFNANENQRHLSQIEILEEACWNGLLDEVLPELIENPVSGKKLFLWYIRNGGSFIQVERAESPAENEKHFSINADYVISAMSSN
jgi:hypothetical protein